MKICATALALLTLLALVPCAQCLAETSPTATAPASAEEAGFLSTLPGGQSKIPGSEALPPSPQFLSTVCTSHSQCPTGQLCCYPCGIDGCNHVCMTPVKGRCPLFV